MSEPSAVIAEALYSCGIEDGDRVEVPEILAALKAARIEMVSLPEPSQADGTGRRIWNTATSSIDASGGRVWLEDFDMEPHEAREDAAALLAAADHAEGES